MPQCSGIELAQVIRQQDPFVSIPIVFLSAEDDTDKQLIAMSGGGDDFLTKPISAHHLISAVIARAIRSRTLRSEMIEDSLTGLLNHTRILEQLDLEIVRSKRNASPLSFAMIDIDHFKTINDSHGHPVGDRVIKGLARLLKQRLRKMDSIGRYGGEEFAIIFPQTEGKELLNKLEEIRRGFSKLLHRSADPLIEFSATFSIGLAQLTDTINTVDKMVQAADKALYMAKEQGRNCTVFYNQQQ
jgi:diguanylate cyclase (GGDEF)-like protein